MARAKYTLLNQQVFTLLARTLASDVIVTQGECRYIPFEDGDTAAVWPDNALSGIPAKQGDVFAMKAGERLHVKNVTTESLIIEHYENGA